jgi:hypothetical protein
MYVEVKDGLSSARADVKNGPVSLLDVALAGNLSRDQMAASDDLGVGRLSFFQSRKMFLGHDEHVRGRLRTDVFEGDNMFVFVNLLRGNLAANDAAEEAVGGSVSHGCLWVPPGSKDRKTIASDARMR